MQFIKSKVFLLVFVLWTLLLSPAVPVLWAFRVQSRAVRTLAQFWVKGAVYLCKMIVGLEYNVKGQNNIPNAPFLLICNHQSMYETLLIPCINEDISLVAKNELERIPAFGWSLRNYPTIMLDRQAGAVAVREMISKAQQLVISGRSIAIFPEGTRQDVHSRFAAKRSVYLMYKILGIPAVPAAVNTGLFWGKDSKVICSGCATISFLPEIPPGLDHQEFFLRLEDAINSEKYSLIENLNSNN